MPFNEADCLAYDPFAGDRYDSDFKDFGAKIVTAAKPHDCHLCFGPIAKGERHRIDTCRMDGEMHSARFCGLCCEAMAISQTDNGAAIEAREPPFGQLIGDEIVSPPPENLLETLVERARKLEPRPLLTDISACAIDEGTRGYAVGPDGAGVDTKTIEDCRMRYPFSGNFTGVTNLPILPPTAACQPNPAQIMIHDGGQAFSLLFEFSTPPTPPTTRSFIDLGSGVTVYRCTEGFDRRDMRLRSIVTPVGRSVEIDAGEGRTLLMDRRMALDIAAALIEVAGGEPSKEPDDTMLEILYASDDSDVIVGFRRMDDPA